MISADQYERQMLDLINAERTSRGLSELSLEANLNLAAEDHSDWMLRVDIFDHTGAWDSSPSERMVDAGYDLVPGWGTAENIAVRTVSGDVSADVLALHTQLMNSSGHRANILNPALTHIGLGIEFGGFNYGTDTQWESIIVTQNFGYTAGSADLDSPTLPPDPPNGGNEVIRGTLDNDTLEGGVGKDRIIAFKGNDLLDGGTDNDRLFGKGGNDTMLGRRGDDKLVGGSGQDIINGGTGDDLLFGEGGADTFVYRPTYQIDRIKDFDAARDSIDLTAFDFESEAQALGYATQRGSNLVFNFELGDKLILTGATLSDISDNLVI